MLLMWYPGSHSVLSMKTIFQSCHLRQAGATADEQPFLWRPLGYLRSKSGFSKVLVRSLYSPVLFPCAFQQLPRISLVSSIPCFKCYLDDSALAGPRSSFCRVLTYIQELPHPPHTPPWAFSLTSLCVRYSHSNSDI